LKSKLISVLTLVALLFVLLPAIPASPISAAEGEVWVLAEKRIEPASGSFETMANEMMANSGTLSDTRFTFQSAQNDILDAAFQHREPHYWMNIFTYTFSELPDTLTPGETVTIKITGTASYSGDEPTKSSSHEIWFRLASTGVEPVPAWLGEQGDIAFVLPANSDTVSKSISFVVPPVTPEGEIQLNITLGVHGIFRVYRPGEPAKTEPATGGEHPLVGWVTASGKVYIERSGKRILVTKDGTPVLAGDRIITGSDALARVDLPSEDPALPGKYPGPNEQPSYSKLLTVSQFFEESPGLLILGENDEIEMHAPEDAPSQGLFGLIMGEVRAIVNNWPSGSIFNVKAGVTICGIRGSDVFISYDPDTERVEAYVIEGHMDVTNSETGEMKSLTDNQKLVVENGNIGEIQPLSQAEWDSLMKENGLEDMQPLSQEELDALLAEKNGESSGSSAMPFIIGGSAVVVVGLALFGLRKRMKKA